MKLVQCQWHLGPEGKRSSEQWNCMSKFNKDQEGLPNAHNCHQKNGKLKVQHSRSTQWHQQAWFQGSVHDSACLTLPREWLRIQMWVSSWNSQGQQIAQLYMLHRSSSSPPAASVECSFSMLDKLLAKDRNFFKKQYWQVLGFLLQFNTVVHIPLSAAPIYQGSPQRMFSIIRTEDSWRNVLIVGKLSQAF